MWTEPFNSILSLNSVQSSEVICRADKRGGVELCDDPDEDKAGVGTRGSDTSLGCWDRKDLSETQRTRRDQLATSNGV